MSTAWSLPTLLGGLHDKIAQELDAARRLMGHPVDKGDNSEAAWIQLLETYLPNRYAVNSGHIVDSEGAFSHQIDIIVFDRQYTPLIFKMGETDIVPAEGVYAVFEAKQTVTAEMVRYAREKAESVRRLHRTSLPIPHAGGTYDPRPLTPILGGLLTFESNWSPPLGASLLGALEGGEPTSWLELGCVAAHGTFGRTVPDQQIFASPNPRAATAFLLELMARLQSVATVPMIDLRAYARWLSE